MGNTWLKIKIWSKVAVAGLLAIFGLVFILENKGKDVQIWFWGTFETTVLQLLFFTVVFSVIATVLVGTAYRTVKEVRELRARLAQDKMKKDVADLQTQQSKAAMLKTKPGEAKS